MENESKKKGRTREKKVDQKEEFDFKKRGRTLREVSREEKRAAMDELIKYVAGHLKGRMESGAFARSWFGSKTPVQYFVEVAYRRVFDRRNLDNKKAWKDNLTLTDWLKGYAKSDMGHWVREWKSKQEKIGYDKTESDYEEPDTFANRMAVYDEDKISDEERETLDEMDDEERRIGFEEVEELVKDNPKLAKYVQAVKDLNDIRSITKRLKITKKQFEEMETETLKLIHNYLKKKNKVPKSRAVSLR